MSNRYIDPENRKNHYKNTDNENTQYFYKPSDNYDTAEIPYSNRNRKPQQQQQNPYQHDEQYYREGNSPPQSRNSYYDDESPINRRRQPQGGYGYSQSGSQQRPVSNPDRPRQQRRPSSGGNAPQRRTSNGGAHHSQHNPTHNKRTQQEHRRQQNNNNRPVNKNNYDNRKPPKRKKRKKNIFLRIILVILIILLLIFGTYSCAAMTVINKLNYQESVQRTHSSSALSKSYVTTILLMGTDSRGNEERGRSDTMILLTVNSKTDEITLTSLMRDCYVDIPGRGMDKLTHAYSYGGAELLMDTIENNFSVRIDDYIAVNFISFAKIVDALGGIEIEISDAEAQEINTILQAEVNEIMGDAVDADLLSGGGKVKLNGKQTLSYARIRHVGNADFERTERQRNVLTQLAGNIKSLSPSAITEIANEAVPQVTTNMSKSELYLLSLRLPFFIGYDIKQIQIPAEGTYSGGTAENGMSVLNVDFDANIEILEDSVFTDKK